MWNLRVIDTDKALYVAIADAMERDIRNGTLAPGEKMPTHRELARAVGVNVTTVTRAYREAEKRGLVISVVGSGTYVSSDSGCNTSLVDTDRDTGKLIEMGLVHPLYGMEPDIRPIVESVLHQVHLKELMAYTPPQGLYRHRLAGSEWMRRYGVNAGPDEVIVTAGAQHALNCIFSSVFQPGDRIAVDCLVYPGVKTAARRCGVQLEAVEMDREGITPQALGAVCRRESVKGVYTVPTMQNPTNASMSARRRAEIAEIIRQYDLTLIEDDQYRFLCEEKDATLSRLLPERSIYIAGISKAFYAGLRVAFTAAPARYCNRIAQAVVDTQWMAPALNVEIACECIASGTADEIIARKREEIRRRAERMETRLSGYRYRYLPGSMFAWLELPGDWSAGDFEKAANANGVNVIAAYKFSVGGSVPPNCVRISLTGADHCEDFEKGLEILRRMLGFEIGPPPSVL